MTTNLCDVTTASLLGCIAIIGPYFCFGRVAGNVVNDFVLGSIIFAIEQLGVRLVMVLGHTRCTVVARAVHKWACKRSHTVLDKGTAQALAADLQGSSYPDHSSQVGALVAFTASSWCSCHEECDAIC